MSVVFAVENVGFEHPGGRRCLDGVSFEIASGERVGLLGANGSGKSTLLHLLDGLWFATSGTITAFGTTLTELAVERPPFGPQFRRQVGFLFQNSDAQLFCATVEEELAFAPLQLETLSRKEIRGRIGEVLELLEIGHLRDRTPQTLSAGEKKLVALASVLMVGPSVLLLDEPTAGLDPRSQAILLQILDDLHEAGLTLVTATHDLALLPHLADRALVLSEEHMLVADAPAEEVLNDTGLLLSVNLIHAHTHRHGSITHSHAHQHVVAHDHEHA